MEFLLFINIYKRKANTNYLQEQQQIIDFSLLRWSLHMPGYDFFNRSIPADNLMVQNGLSSFFLPNINGLGNNNQILPLTNSSPQLHLSN